MVHLNNSLLNTAGQLRFISAQGLTLGGAILNTGGRGCFSNGQLCVALSRIRRLDKFCLMRPIRYGELMTSKEVKYFYENQDKYVSKYKGYKIKDIKSCKFPKCF